MMPTSLYGNYTSCIKIAGAPILPPLMSDERQVEAQRWKLKALMVEERARERMANQQRAHETRPNTATTTLSESGISSKNTSSSSKETDKDLSFNSSQLQNLSSSTITSDHLNNNENVTVPNCDEFNEKVDISGDKTILSLVSKEDEARNNISEVFKDPDDTELLTREPPNLFNTIGNLNLSPCKNLVLKSDLFNTFGKITCRSQSDAPNGRENMEFKFSNVSDKDKFFDNYSLVQIDNMVKSTGSDIMNNNASASDGIIKSPVPSSEETICENTPFKPPKLIRRNSYTLESPSPQLVAFMENQKESKIKKPVSLKRIHNWGIASEEKKSTNFKPFKTKKPRKAWNIDEARIQWNQKFSPRRSRRIDSMSLPTVSPDLVQMKMVSKSNECVFECNSKLVSPNEKQKSNSHSSPRVLKNEESHLKIASDLSTTLTPEKDIHNSSYASGDGLSVRPQTLDTASNCSSVSLNKYIPQFDMDTKMLICDVKYRHELELVELLRRQEEELEIVMSRMSVSSNFSANPHCTTPSPVTLPLEPNRLSNESNKSRCIRKLQFSNMKCPLDCTEKEKWAASKIVAYAKGYLTRRLLKTERVQGIIASIKESVQCAMNLHQEPNLSSADIDLHHRLIMQANAGVMDLHDVIHLSPSGKMAIIRTDRKRKQTSRLRVEKQALSSATRRVLMRKQQTQSERKEQNVIKQKGKTSHRRRKTISYISSEYKCQKPVQQPKKTTTTRNLKQ